MQEQERITRTVSKEYHKCFMQKCKKEQKQLDQLHKEHQNFIKILNTLKNKEYVTEEEFFRLLKANSDRIRSDPLQSTIIDCKIQNCYDAFYKYTLLDIETSLQKNISPDLRRVLQKYHKKFKDNKITTEDMIEYSKELYNSI